MSSALAASPFKAAYAPLQEGAPELGQIAVLGWDSDIFGFSVADYRAGELPSLLADPAAVAARLSVWTRQHGVELVGCRIPANPATLGALLESVDFRFVEAQLRVTLPRLRAMDLRPPRISVRAAAAADRDAVVSIAESAFTLGRYHADPRFPRALANRRFRIWIERALEETSGNTWVGVVGPEGSPNGFLHAEIAGELGDIRLAAVDHRSGGIAGPELFLGALHELASRGARQATARVSAAGSAVMNIYASLGFRFHEPELVFHWHRPDSPHWVALSESCEHPPR